MKMMNKRGFTLMELLVYMGLLGIIVAVAGRAFSDSTKFRVRTEGMLQSSQVATNALDYLAEDLAQLGAKTAKESESGGFHSFNKKVLMDSTSDSASFSLTKIATTNAEMNRDQITFRKITYDEKGIAEFLQQISWKLLDNGELYRVCGTVEILKSGAVPPDNCPAKTDPRETLIAEGIENLQFIPGKRLQDGSFQQTTNGSLGMFKLGTPFALASRSTSGFMQLYSVANNASAKISGFATNYREDGSTPSEKLVSQLYLLQGNPTTSKWEDCFAFTFEPQVTYGVSFQILVDSDVNAVNYMRNFQVGVDHIAVGFREKGSGNPIATLSDFMVYPSLQSSDAGRYLEFSSPQKVTNACLTITVSLYSPLAYRGNFNIMNVAVSPRDGAKYEFNNDNGADISTASSRRQIKAFKVRLSANKNKEVSKVERVVPTPNNGTGG